MKAFWGVLTLVVIGVIVADLVTHPAGTGSALGGLSGFLGGALDRLTGSGQKRVPGTKYGSAAATISNTITSGVDAVGEAIGGSGCNALATAFASAVRAKFPTAIYAGCYNCRCERGSGSNPACVSEHAFGNALDFFGPVGEIKDWANSPDVQQRYSIDGAWIDAVPGDVHIQFTPAHGCTHTAPCGARCG